VELGTNLEKVTADGDNQEPSRQNMLEPCADRDKRNSLNRTHNGHLQMVKLLMSFGADMNARNKHSALLPIDIAAAEEIEPAI
jgi:hypothetical protein